MKKLYIFLFLTCLAHFGMTQGVARRTFSKKRQAYTDSLKNINYNYALPIFGKKVYKLGFDIPYPIGMMGNVFYAKQGIVIEDIKLGFETPNNTVDPIDFGQVIGFENNTSELINYNFRPDVWVFPFLNVYGVFGYTPFSQTTVNIKLFNVEDTFTSKPIQTGYNYGFGLNGAFGLGPVWVSLDGNWSWAQMELLDRPVNTKIFGVRVGHTFVFKNKPERNIAIWAGAMRVKIDADTKGKIRIGDALDGDPEDLDARLIEARDKMQETYDNWDPITPGGEERKEQLGNLIGFVDDFIDLKPIRNTYVSYELNKRLEDAWSGLIGAQFQFNKRWMLRSEVNFIGDRFSVLGSINYRFLGPKSK